MLCTDGIVEATNAADQPFGTERLQKLIQAFKDQPIKQLVEQLGNEVTEHYVGDSPPDDLTVLALRRIS